MIIIVLIGKFGINIAYILVIKILIYKSYQNKFQIEVKKMKARGNFEKISDVIMILGGLSYYVIAAYYLLTKLSQNYSLITG